MQSTSNEAWYPGQIWSEGTEVALEDREIISLEVKNTGDRPVQVGSHFHFFEVNKALVFDREGAYGFRLAIPAGTAVRFEPGEKTTVTLISLGGRREVYGCNALVSGSLEKKKTEALALAKSKGFLGGQE
jgi:urease beta subunit